MTGNVIALSEALLLGIHGMCLLAATRKRMSAREMAEVLGVSEAHLTKVFQRLVREGLAVSMRGPGGGFDLRGRPEEISLLSIYQAIEGGRADTEVSSCCTRCVFTDCFFESVLKSAADKFLEHLSQTTLAQAALKSPERAALASD